MDIRKELSKNQIMLLLIPGAEYNDITVDIAKQLSGENMCYVTLNKTYSAIDEHLRREKADTDKVIYIDCISRLISETPDHKDNCYFVDSPGAVEDISNILSKFLGHKAAFFPNLGPLTVEYFIFDSLTNLTIYESKAKVIKFFLNLVTKIRDGKTRAVFYALKSDERQELIQEVSMLVDKVVDLTKK